MRPSFPLSQSAGLLGLGLAAVLALAGPAHAQQPRPLPALSHGPDDALTRALATGEVSAEEYALERARSLFDLRHVRREFGDVERPVGRDATLLLRDLALRVHRLSGDDRQEAEAVLARPDDRKVPPDLGKGWWPVPSDTDRVCSDTLGVDVCVHWVRDAGHPDAAPSQEWVDLTLGTLEDVWGHEIGTLAYRPPLSDEDSENDGGGPELDVYLDDLQGVFGYCATDDPDAFALATWTVSAYCVLDNDFVGFGSLAPQRYLEVTAAHELFHASQFAYDVAEDDWFMEGTATNMETTVYPTVRDNVQFLRDWVSPLSRPQVPLDRSGLGDGAEYGSWIFWRFLEEKIAGNDPRIVRRLWTRAAVLAPKDVYSLLAVRKELRKNYGLEVEDAFQQFARANRLRDYAQARAGTPWYPTARRTRVWTLGKRNRSTGWKRWKIDHLASRHFSFVTARNAPRRGRLDVRARLPERGARATVIVVYENGRTRTHYLSANARDVARRTVSFGRTTVARVDLVLTNGSDRTRCGQDFFEPYYSCFGLPRDDGQVYELRARIR